MWDDLRPQEGLKQNRMPSKEKEMERFDTAMHGLMDHCKVIIKTRESACLKNAGVNPILKCLNKYEKIYNHEDSDPELHKDTFAAIYKKYRANINRGYTHDDWLKDNKVNIQFGEGAKAREQRIMLSTIYSTAVTLRDAAHKRLDGLSDEAWQDCHEVNYPEITMLYLYRIFREVATDSKDKEVLAKLIKEIEEELDVESDSKVTSQQGSSGVIENAFGALTSSLGLGSALNSKDLSKAFSSIMDNPQIKSVLSSTMKDIQGGNPTKIMENLSAILPPEFTSAITGVMGSALSSQGPAAQQPVPLEESGDDCGDSMQPPGPTSS